MFGMSGLLSGILLFVCSWIGIEGVPSCHDMEPPPPDWMIYNVVRWTPLVERVDEPYLTVPLVLAVIAQESGGLNGQTSTDGYASVGLMQVIPRQHFGTPTQLMVPYYNVWIGTRILNSAIEQAAEYGFTDDPVRYGLAAYNCGWQWHEGTPGHFENCRTDGGLRYADRVLHYWCPYFEDGTGCGIPPEVQLDPWHNKPYINPNWLNGSHRIPEHAFIQ